MTLKGWINPLPDYIIKAVNDEKIIIKHSKDYDYLIGETNYPNSKCIVIICVSVCFVIYFHYNRRWHFGYFYNERI